MWHKCCQLLCYCNFIDLYSRLSEVGQCAHMGCMSKSWGLSIITGAVRKGSDNTIIPLPGAAVAASPFPSTVTLTFCIGAPITDILGGQHRQKETQMSWNILSQIPVLGKQSRKRRDRWRVFLGKVLPYLCLLITVLRVLEIMSPVKSKWRKVA